MRPPMSQKTIERVVEAPQPHWVGDGFYVRPLFADLLRAVSAVEGIEMVAIPRAAAASVGTLLPSLVDWKRT